MTLPITWTLRAHCRVINFLNFNIIVSKGIGQERDGGTAGQWRSQKVHIYWLFAILYDCGTYMIVADCGTPKQLQ